MKTIRLRPGKERSLVRRHPWVFEGSVDRGKADAGETVRVESSAGEFLAWAAYSPMSKIRLRPGASTKPSASMPGSCSAASPGRWHCVAGWLPRATLRVWCTVKPTACRG
jgi:hypothetical protein